MVACATLENKVGQEYMDSAFNKVTIGPHLGCCNIRRPFADGSKVRFLGYLIESRVNGLLAQLDPGMVRASA